MTTEYRSEICDDCGYDFERLWDVKNWPQNQPVPTGWRVLSSRGSWKRIGQPTRYGTLCMCDAEV